MEKKKWLWPIITMAWVIIIMTSLIGCDAVNDIIKAEADPVAGTMDIEEMDYLDPYSYLVLINSDHRLEANFSPSDLRIINVLDYTGNPATTKYMRETAATMVEALFQAASDEAGFTLLAKSAYRSYQAQEQLYYHKVGVLGQAEVNRLVALPGYSEHQTGLALDVAAYSPDGFERVFGDTLESQWLAQNAHRFGFIIRFPAGRESETGFMHEPWHIRYVGIEAATYIYENGLILEEFLQLS